MSGERKYGLATAMRLTASAGFGILIAALTMPLALFSGVPAIVAMCDFIGLAAGISAGAMLYRLLPRDMPFEAAGGFNRWQLLATIILISLIMYFLPEGMP